MTVKKHYESHLGNFYTWMLGDWEKKSEEFKSFLIRQSVTPKLNQKAIDMGAGNGIQSIPLAELGYHVTAIDFNPQLLNELNQNIKKSDLPIQIIDGEITNFALWKDINPELILCCGDTISHLESFEEIKEWMKQCYSSLLPGGKIILSFRDYSKTLQDNERFIPVKSDENRIHTCILDFSDKNILVTDLLYEKIKGEWQMSVSSYRKVRTTLPIIQNYLKEIGFLIIVSEVFQRMNFIIATK
ncbi:class I SAM-dependent methyltransferase [Leptospira jelokensis]|uniref:Class I SAM-dependent methyltransferase n=1 Tax=Leptospira jelokensis TaxID=2484931 RepID=A0A4Z0ZN67_9LEPT|nr:class I SAM-dependent methyltransferase [Leptospira jelokensis]TGL57833.1 class I SAM-dependent methyltransferase [Leptospira jelokensis]